MKAILFAVAFLLLSCPAAAANLTAEQAGSTITLAWDANMEPDLAGYRIYAGHSSGGPYSKIGEVGAMPAPTFVTPVLANGTWYFVVTAYNTAGLESGYSNEVSKAIALPPAPPKNLIIRILQAIAAVLARLLWIA